MNTEVRDADDLLARLGFGKWNIVYIVGLTLWNFVIPFQILAGAYLVPALPFTCRPPEQINVTAIADDSCSYEYVSVAGELVVEPCTEWDFDNSVYPSTMTQEFNLVCGREYLRASFTSLFMFANAVSGLLSGYPADRYGRLKVMVVAHLVITFFSFVISFLKSMPFILAARFMQGLGNINTIVALTMEVCKIRHRASVTILATLSWAVGTMMLSGVAYLIDEWRWIQLAASFPNLLLFLPLWFMDDPPRWLMVAGQEKKVLKVLNKAARWNKVSLPPEPQLKALIDDISKEAKRFKTQTEESERKGKCCGSITAPDLCNPRIRRILVIMSLNFFTSGMVFYGLTLNGANLSTDPYLYLTLSALLEVPAYLFTAPLISKFGRKKPSIISFLVCGVSILALTFTPPELGWLALILSLIGKLCISSVFIVIIVYITELIPTEVRLQALGLCKFWARCGSIISPFVTDLFAQWLYWAPSVVFGGIAVLAGLATMGLPETKGAPLPDTISHLTRPVKDNNTKRDGKECKEMQDAETPYPEPSGPAVA